MTEIVDVAVEEIVKEVPKELIRLNLGCGIRKLNEFINIDINKKYNPDIVYDIRKGIPYGDNSVEEIQAIDLLNCLTKSEVLDLMKEIYRVLRIEGKFFHSTPTTDGRGAFENPFNLSHWNINTWKYYFTYPDYQEIYNWEFKFRIVALYDMVISTEDKIINTFCTYVKI